MIYTKKDALISRIENNYTDFKCSLRGVSREKLFEIAGRISVVKEVYHYMKNEYKWDDEGELDYLLLFRDPLTIIADAWEDYRDEMVTDMDGVIYDVGDELLYEYPLYCIKAEI